MGYWEGIGPEEGTSTEEVYSANQLRRYGHLCDEDREEIRDGEHIRD